MDLFVVFIHLGGIVHGAEFRAAHGAEGCFPVVIVWQSFVVHGARGFWIKRKRKLLFPVEFVARVAEGIVAVLRTGTMTGQVGGVSRDFVSNDAIFYVFCVWEAEMLFWRYVAEHGRAVPSDHGRSDGRGDVVVAGGDVCNQWA